MRCDDERRAVLAARSEQQVGDSCARVVVALRDEQVLQNGQRRQQVELLQHAAAPLSAQAIADARRELADILELEGIEA